MTFKAYLLNTKTGQTKITRSVREFQQLTRYGWVQISAWEYRAVVG
jgi:hypothetical protein